MRKLGESASRIKMIEKYLLGIADKKKKKNTEGKLSGKAFQK